MRMSTVRSLPTLAIVFEESARTHLSVIAIGRRANPRRQLNEDALAPTACGFERAAAQHPAILVLGHHR